MLAGLIQIGVGILGVGKYIRYIPYPVVSGFMTAIGVMILVTQLQPMVGYKAFEDPALVEKFTPQAEEVLLDKILQEEAGEGLLVLEDFEETIKRAKTIEASQIKMEAIALAKNYSKGVLGTLKVIPYAIKSIKWLEVLLALATILIIYGFKRITSKIPSTLVALVIVSGVAYIAKLPYLPIDQIPSGFPKFNYEIFTNFSFVSFSPYILTAVSLAFLGAIDSLLTSVVADNMTKTRHEPNRELIGQGIGNSIASLFGGIPEETPKAKARGSATIPAVIPPKASPLKFEKNCFIITRSCLDYFRALNMILKIAFV